MGDNMSSFTIPLVVSPLPDGRNWVLRKSFSYHVGSKFSRFYIKVPKGFETDFASIPKFLFFLPLWAKYNKAPVLHDWLYHSKQVMGESISRKYADDIFLEAMLIEWRNRKSRYFIAQIEYWAVRLCAWVAWK